MNRLIFILLTFCTCQLMANKSNEPLKRFTSEPKNFVAEVRQFIGTSSNEDDVNFLNFFKMKWDSLKYTKDQQLQIIKISNCYV